MALAGNQTLVADTDRDGLSDSLENYGYGTDPARWDSTASGIPDGWLVEWGLDPGDPRSASHPAAAPVASTLPEAYRGDWPPMFALTVGEVYSYARPANWNEAEQGPFHNGLDPTSWDNNRDGIPDGWGVAHGLDPRAAIATQRLAGEGGLTVFQAFQNNTDPHKLDSDGDGLPDLAELTGTVSWGGQTRTFRPTNPRAASTAGTGVCDGYLVGHGLGADTSQDALGDADLDGATTQREYNWSRTLGDPCASPLGLDPSKQVSGPSGIPDGWFLLYGLDPFHDAEKVTDEAPGIPAAAGLPGLPAIALRARDEYAFGRPPSWSEPRDGPWLAGSDPTRHDTDGDGLDDATELQGWTVVAALVPGTSSSPEHVAGDPTQADADGDSLPDGAERDAGTHPRRSDTDFDGIPDGAEIALDLQFDPDPVPGARHLDPTQADSAGDLLRDGDRLALLQGRAAAILLGGTSPLAGPEGPRGFEEVARGQAGGRRLPPGVSPAQVADLFGPAGDLDDDGQRNLLDADIDDDDLGNGVEAQPLLYVRTVHGAGPFAAGRSSTDPEDPDTDGDGLEDGWEVGHGVPDLSIQAMDLEPARGDSDADGTADGHEDPDLDGILVPQPGASGLTLVPHPHDNLAEQAAGTDPHVASSDKDGLLDGWKAFWGQQYTGPRNGLPVPTPGSAQAGTVVSRFPADRFTTRPDLRRTDESALGPLVQVTPSSGPSYAVQRMHADVAWTFLSIQAHGANPYEADTDRDGLPDPWEAYQSSPSSHPRPDSVARCVDQPSQAGLLQPDGEEDPDGDGLTNLQERAVGTDPLCADSDLGGLADGIEAGVLDPTDTADDVAALHDGQDSDGDGPTDFQEITRSPPTDPHSPDTDGDGLLDGTDLGTPSNPIPGDDPRHAPLLALGIAFRQVGGGSIFLGETARGGGQVSDPLVADTRIPGVPDGWVLAHGNSPAPDWEACYRYGLPDWWSLALHGPWWGGGDPFDAGQDCEELAATPDRDGDGLADAAGEDPVPVVSHANDFPIGSPFAPGLSAVEVRERAQAVMHPRVTKQYRVVREDWSGPALPVRPTLLTVSGGMPGILWRGEGASISGSLRDGQDNAGIAGTTIVVRLDGQDIGAAFTDAQGAFEVPVVLTAAHAVPVPQGRILRGQTGASTARWTDDPLAWTPGAHTLEVASYALDRGAEVQGGARQQASVTVKVHAMLDIPLPDSSRPGELLTVQVHEHDPAGAPLTDPLQGTWAGSPLGTLQVNAQGRATLQLTAPGNAGAAHLALHSIPGNANVISAEAGGDVGIRLPGRVAIDPLPARADAGTPLAVSGRASTQSGPVVGVPVSVRVTLAETVLGVDVATDAQGVFHAAIDLPGLLPPGMAVVSASIPAGASNTEGGAGSTFRVRALTRLVETAPAHLAATGARTIEARLLDGGGRPVAGQALALALGDERRTATTDALGAATFTLTAVLSSGPHQEEIHFGGNGLYAPALLQRERLVQSATSLAVRASPALVGTRLSVVAELMDAAGTALAGQAVRVRLGDGATSLQVTDAKGMASFHVEVPADSRLGSVPLAARFAATSAYQASAADAVVQVRAPTRLDVPRGEFLLEGPPLVGYLRDHGGQPLGGAEVLVSSGGPLRTERTAPDGSFPLLASGTPDARDLGWTGHYLGDNRHAGASASGTLALRLPAILSGDTPAGVVQGEVGSLAVAATTVAASAVTGDVDAVLDGIVAGTVHLENGSALLRIRVPADAAPGTHVLRLHFTSARHAAPAIEVPLLVAGRTVLEARMGPGKPGQQVTVTLVATTAGRPLPHAALAVRTEDDPAGFTVTTDEHGRASLELAYPLRARPLLVRFAGSPEASAAVLATQMDPQSVQASRVASYLVPLLTAGAATALLAAAGLVVALRRQAHPVLRALRATERALAARGPYEADIMLCYGVLQDELQAQGVLEGPAPTPRLLGEAVARHLPAGAGAAPLEALLSLFEQARYGGLPLGSSARDQARTAMRNLRLALQRTGAAAVPEAA
ncbi:MAG TPA: DUF4129 domain-containing protein [Candidatus Thermoplasmatota archaeon]|nr:DUF4129 domain-containing protein [Candidatus Thermoplasmatota archaeon]